MMYFKGSSMSELYAQILGHVLEYGDEVSPRGMDTIEVSPLVFELTDPEECLVLQKARRLNYAFVVAERLALLSGTANPEMLCFYVSRLRDFVNETTGCFDGAYGPRIRPQLEYVFDELSCDAASRRAVLSIFGPEDHRPSLDVPCTLTLQFLVRDESLDLIVSMRSSDLYLGLPYDVGQFAFLQQVLAGWLSLPAGRYIQWSASAHVYARDLAFVSEIVSSAADLRAIPLRTPRLSKSEWVSQIALLTSIESQMRNRDGSMSASPEIVGLAPDLRVWAELLSSHASRKRTAEASPVG